jgi:hypothetical protein
MQEQVPRSERQRRTVLSIRSLIGGHGRRDKFVGRGRRVNVFVCVDGVGHGVECPCNCNSQGKCLLLSVHRIIDAPSRVIH